MNFEEIARTFLEAVTSDIDTYSSVKGEIVKNSSSSFSLLTPNHIQWAYAGRAPGKNPPLSAMLDLVNSKNILFDGLDKKGTAFAIMFSIAKKGTKNYKPNAGNIMLETVKKYQSKYKEDLGSFVLVDINDKLNKEMKEYWETQEKLLKDFKI